MHKKYDDDFYAEFRGDKYTEEGLVIIEDGVPFFKDAGRLFGKRAITNRVVDCPFYEVYIKKSHLGDTGREKRIYHFDTSGKDGKFKFGAEIESRIQGLVNERNALKLENAGLREEQLSEKADAKVRDYMRKLFDFVKDIKDRIFIPPKEGEEKK